MNTRNDILRHVQESLGSECTRDDAEAIVDHLYARDLIDRDMRAGSTIKPGVDLLAVAAEVLGA